MAASACRVSFLREPEERFAHPVPDTAAAGLASATRVFPAAVHGCVGPARVSGTSYRLFPGAGDAAGNLDRVAVGDLVAGLGTASAPAGALPAS